jgi:hypothetical protein
MLISYASIMCDLYMIKEAQFLLAHEIDIVYSKNLCFLHV